MNWHDKSPFVKKMLYVVGFLIGLVGGTFLVFQVLFLMKVIPHGGI